MKTLLTVKEYCKLQKITDAGARKQISAGRIAGITLDDQTYVVVESNEVNLLKASLKSSREKIRTLQARALLYSNQSEYIKKLEGKIEELGNKKDAIYEKVIAQYALIAPRQ